jgi:hypothetical protein
VSILDAQYRTVTCDQCGQTVTFEQDQRGVPVDVINANPWLKTNRVVLANGKNFSYCNDLCEVEGIKAGNHNPVEAPKVEVPTGSAKAQIQAAAAAAKEREDATKALKEGSSAKIQLG